MRAQDEAEYTELVAALTQRLHRMGYAICGDRQLAEDAVQSALVSAYRTWPRVRDADSPEAYMRKMVVNQLLSWRRRKSWASPAAMSRSLEPTQASHENEVVEHQLVWSAVGGLPPRQRAVIVLRYYEGLSEAEISDTLGIRPGTVKSQSSAALAHLRMALADTEPAVTAGDDRKGVR